MKILLRSALALVLLALLAVGFLILGLDSALRAAVEKGGTHALGVPTHLESASLGLFSGSLDLAGLAVDNPAGFEDARFLALGAAHTRVSLASLRSDTVRIEALELSDVSLLLQRREGRSNYGVILDHLEGLSGGGQAEPGPEETEGGKRFLIERIVIRNVQVDFDLLPVGGQLTRAKVTLPELVLENVGSGEDGASISDITARVVRALLQASLEAGGQVLSPELLGDLKQQLSQLGTQTIDELGRTLGEGAGKALDDLGSQLDGLLGNKKKKD